MAATPEGKAKAAVDFLLDAAAWYWGTYWFAPPANGYGRSGIPDRVGCHFGRFFGVEVKANSDVTALQGSELLKIEAAQGKWFVVRINSEECSGLFELQEFLGLTDATLQKYHEHLKLMKAAKRGGKVVKV